MDYVTVENGEYNDLVIYIWKKVLIWGNTNMREFPWRNTRDPYEILIAEVMLHRTRASQVEMIYGKFIDDYPDFNSIVRAGKENIRSQLHPLGLTWRSEYLYRMAKEIMERHDGEIPFTVEELMKLPGVGRYIASAVLCFGYDLPVPILDTNTVRVIGRIWGIDVTDSSRRSKKFENIMKSLLFCGEPRKFSLSLIDHAALICKARNMICDECPLERICHFNNLEMC